MLATKDLVFKITVSFRPRLAMAIVHAPSTIRTLSSTIRAVTTTHTHSGGEASYVTKTMK